MPTPLLTTKLSAPPLRQKLVDRQRLISRLNQGAENGFILISAPAGYGKTTLLSAWLDQMEHDSTWLSLDHSDNDLAHFLYYLAAALGKIDPSFGELLTDSLGQNPRFQIETLLTPLINQIAQANQPLYFVMDDYHVIQNQAVHQAVSFMLENRPQQFHLVIATRTDPPLPLSRFRAHSQIFELRMADLRFSREETEQFLMNVIGVDISKDDQALLETSVEGWVAGLQMAGLSLQEREDVSRFIQSFSGKNRYILDFLFEEIFQRQPEDIQLFLLQTSILGRLCGPLCDHLVKRADSHSILKFLEDSNLFLIALDEEREWYRYHNLFQVLLQQQLRSTKPDSFLPLHLGASEWYEAYGSTPEAITHAFSAQDFDRAACLVERKADATLSGGEIKTFLNWVERLPEDVIRKRPLLCVYQAETLLLAGKPVDAMAEYLEGTPEYDVIVALKASYQGDVELSKQISAQVLENLPDESLFLRGIITSTLGAVYLLSGDVVPAIRTFHSSVEIGRQSKNLLLEVIALCRLGQLYHMKGDPHKAEKLIQKGLELASYRFGEFPLASMPLMVLANLKLDMNEVASARSLIQKAVELSEKSGGFWAVDCYLVYSWVLQAQGNAEAALEAMQKARNIAAQTEANQFDDIYITAYQARLNISQGNLDAAIQWAWQRALFNVGVLASKDGRSQLNPDLFHLVELEGATLARIYISQGKSDEALAILSFQLPETEKRGRRKSIIENLILQALAYQSNGNIAQALDTLEKALVLAEPCGYIRFFLDEGENLQGLLVKLIRAWRSKTQRNMLRPVSLQNYVQALIVAFDHQPGPEGMGRDINGAGKVPHPNSMLAEPLSKRELEVINLLAQGLSDKEIAKSLVISGETVHKHLKNTYGKLGVHSRTEAIARARKMGLL